MGSPYAYQSGSGGGTSTGSGTGKNYLGTVNNVNGNGDFELGSTTKWNLGLAGSSIVNGLPQGTPTFGSGASGNLSISAINSSPLAGSWSLRYASSAATTQGNALHSDVFTIDREDQGKVLTGKVYYRAQVNPTNGNWSGTSSNSFGIAIYDGSSWIYPAGAFGMTQSSGIGYVTFTFQTSSTSQTYSLWVYNANASAGAITVDFDDFSIGPQTAPLGYPASDSISFTPTSTWVTNATHTGKWSRSGEMMNLQYQIAVGPGAPTSAALIVNLPSGYSIDTNKLLSTISNLGPMPGTSGTAYDAGVNAWTLSTRYSSATAVSVMYSVAASQQAQVTQAAPTAWGTGDYIELNFSVPIASWSSNVQMSNDTDTRVVAAIISGQPTGTIATFGSQVTAVYPTVSQDTHGGYNTTTGLYTVPVTGFYDVSGSALITFTSGTPYLYGMIYVDSVNTQSNYVYQASAGDGTPRVAGLVYARAGQTISVRFATSGASPAYTNSAPANNYLNIKRVSGPSVIAATETVSAYYTGAPPTGTLNGSGNKVTFGTKVSDSHNAYASGVYTVPVSGRFSISAQTGQTATYAAGNVADTYIVVNSTTKAEGVQVGFASAGTLYPQVNINSVPLLAGDLVEIRALNNGTTPTYTSQASINYFSIVRVGNY